jgi:hypothetical protein
LHCELGNENSWALRICHEALLSSGPSWFVTNTFAPEYAVPESSVSREVHQLYVKRVRRRFGKVRYVVAGEYGEQWGRPHYHYALFGLDVPDLKYSRSNERGERLYTSEVLSKLWGFGFVEVAPLDVGGARYLAGYLSRDRRAKEPGWNDYIHDDGRVTARDPAFFLMSRRPGIGRGYVEKFGTQFAAHDFVVLDGRKYPRPQYYTRLLEQLQPELAEKLKAKAEASLLTPQSKANRAPGRLAAKDVILKARRSLGRRGSARAL